MIKHQLQQQFQNLSRREQRLLTLASPLVIALAIWLSLIKPLQTEQQRLQNQLENKQLELAWMQSASTRLEQLRQLQTDQTPAPLQQQLQQLLQRSGIRARLNAMPDNRMSVVASNIAYNSSLQLLQQLELNHIQLEQVEISASKRSGRVDLKLQLIRVEIE
ncbi:MAG: type II secretion system protein M [Marinobacterium sp.]|nr:type II secretion system protein M [Marinobacterium sp.]